MRIYSENTKTVVVNNNGSQSIQPVTTDISANGNVSVYSYPSGVLKEGPVHFSNVFKADGVTPIGTTLALAKQYLIDNTVFNTASGGSGALGIRENKTITTTSYTLQEEDKDKFLIFTNGSPITVEVPIGLSESASYMLLQQGPGKVIINLLSTATVNTAATLDGGTRERYSVLEIRCVDTDSYVIYGEQGSGGF